MRVPERPSRLDLGVAVGAAVLACVWSWWAVGSQDPVRPLDPWAYALVVVAAGVLAWRRVAPLPVLAVTLAAAGVYLLVGYPYGPVLLCVCWAMYEVGRRRPVRVSGVAAAIAALVSMATVLPRFANHLNLLVVGLALWGGCWLAVPWALGALTYVRRQAAERERRDLVARAVLEERIRVSREVHDVAGHGFAVVAMQAGVALVVLDEQPEQVRASLEAIRSTSTGALEELRRVLRDEGTDQGLAGLPTLVERARSTGLSVELRVGEALEVPAAVGGLAYRVVRESLTNVLRHAAASTALITVDQQDGALSLTITDDGSGPRSRDEADPRRGGRAARRSGHDGVSAGSGIAGMRNAVEAAGGTLTAGPAATLTDGPGLTPSAGSHATPSAGPGPTLSAGPGGASGARSDGALSAGRGGPLPARSGGALKANSDGAAVKADSGGAAVKADSGGAAVTADSGGAAVTADPGAAAMTIDSGGAAVTAGSGRGLSAGPGSTSAAGSGGTLTRGLGGPARVGFEVRAWIPLPERS